MKNVIVTLLLATTILGFLVGVGHGSPAAPPDDPKPVPPSVAACMQACFDQYQANLAACKAGCKYCNFSLFGICLSWSVDEACFRACSAGASSIYAACERGCVPTVK